MTANLEVDPAEVGLDAGRLARLDAHLARYVDAGRLPGWSLLVARRGRVAHLTTYGRRDVEADLPMEPDTIARVFSMTKPITTLAAMMLLEEGLLSLSTPVSEIIPSFADLRVYDGGPASRPVTVPAARPMRLWHLLTHTSGLTYGFHHTHVTDEIYRSRGFEGGLPGKLDLTEVCDAYASMPLAFEPGTEWLYSVATDVLGRVVEVVSGRSLPDFFAQRILGPLGMTDTGFAVPAADHDRVAALYLAADGGLLRNDLAGRTVLRPLAGAASGGGGLVSTLGDYHRLTELLRGRGETGGVRLLGSRTVDAMTRNQLPGGVDLAAFGRPLFAETPFDGIGFGLGFSVVTDVAKTRQITSAGQYGWGGAAATAFWVDPAEDLTMVFLTQLMSSPYPIRPAIDSLVHAALVD